ncbi:glycerophosphodiester phosphodiesterase [Nocardiopsis changdeensis]|uniref:Glycerophosphodiester phosphodiesterase n=1 Tax=Nocardiopsis changdeensis TaxID=2831969 RepID=A0ABX8BHD1_9ACTN|nr:MULTISPECIES: glycerophosphodiester phosphodiesterase family protein [Nocardiopsis]QUX21521.1 glycerophosphodiester phosphodiesterase [Nocardiopsis changdeensis]QYX37455.1 glycerophosphodiester phosphodiesterase [Nocardiopsis sp. MT53]
MHRIGIVFGVVSLVLAVSAPIAASAVHAPGLDPLGTTTEPVIVQHADPQRPIIAVSHRGAAGHAPENTLAGLDAARRFGALTVEIDVQRTKDGELVLLHDATLTRTTDVEEVFPDRESRLVADYTLAEVRRLDAGSWFSPEFEGEPVPTLGEALDRMRDLDLNLFLEIKEPARYPRIEREIAVELLRRPAWLEHNPAWEPRRLVVQSFDWEVTRSSKRLLPSVPHALLGRVPEDRLSEFTWAHMVNPNHTTIDEDYVELLHEHGYETMPYTVNSRAAMDAVLRMGVDGFITDYPDAGQRAIRDFLDDEGREGEDRDDTPEQVATPLLPAPLVPVLH